MKAFRTLFAIAALALVGSALALVQPQGYAGKSLLRAAHSVSFRGSSEGSSAFNPASIVGLQLWLDASQITGLNDGDAVATWSDRSGNSNNATQATASKRLTYQTGEINGLPIVRGDGIDDFFDLTSPLDLTDYTVFAVMKRAAGAQSVLAGADGAGQSYMGIFTTFGGTLQNENGSFAGNIAADPAVAALLRFSASSGNASFGLDGSDTAFATAVTGSFRFGRIGSRASGQYLAGDLGELIIYNSALGLVNRQLVENYLRAKWGTP